MKKSEFSQLIRDFKFKELFNLLGWDYFDNHVSIAANDTNYSLKGVAEKKGFVIFKCLPNSKGKIPLSNARKKIERRIANQHFEHLIIYTDEDKTKQLWQLTLKELNKPKQIREIKWNENLDTEVLYQRLRNLLFTLDEEENITIIDVKQRISENFAKNTKKVTKKFYREFKKKHDNFMGFIEGINDDLSDKDNQQKQWYASLMLNRLMFCYFIQKKGFLDQNVNYLQDKLKESKQKEGTDNFYNFYRSFLMEMFHNGLGKRPEKPNSDHPVKLGNIPYLNGGLFDDHELEKRFQKIDIPDKAFENIFEFFDKWKWHLDTRTEATGREINPDVLGYIFEKYINDRAQMGAYYTKEDITDYISKNTIIPYLFDETERHYKEAFTPEGKIWRFLKSSGDTYIYDELKKGVPQNGDLFGDLPEEIQKGFNQELEEKKVVDSTEPHLWELRESWNKVAPQDIGLPAETYREVINRRKRYSQIKSKIEKCEINYINDLITYNLDIRQFIQDFIETTEDPKFIMHFYKSITGDKDSKDRLPVSILDPTCGSGAFLFAALNILEPIYEACINRMEQFTTEEPGKYKFFEEVLNEVNSENHPNLKYFIYKNIILHNLYGVDIMKEAVEIAKLRLFLKLVATVDPDTSKDNYGLEPLPDIDFNIRAGNSLVGFASEDELLNTLRDEDGIFADGKRKDFIEKFELLNKAYHRFQDAQLINDKGSENYRKAKKDLNQRLDKLNNKLNKYLATNYGINHPEDKQKQQYKEWLEIHQPFHWIEEFYQIVGLHGGFDVIIGNPPYVEDRKINYKLLNYDTQSCGNLYAYILEKNNSLMCESSKTGMIIPHSAFCTKRMQPLLKTFKIGSIWTSTYDIRPSKLFTGVDQRLAIYIYFPNGDNIIGTTEYNRWNEEERKHLFENINMITNVKDKIGKIILKAGNDFDRGIYKKLSKERPLFNSINNKDKVYYHDTPRYFIRATFDPPYFWNERDGNKVSSHVKTVATRNDEHLPSLVGILNSSIYYWWFILHSNCRDLVKREINNFPIDIGELSSNYGDELDNTTDSLINDYENNKYRKHTHYKTTGKVIYDEYYPKKSKNLIDKIDRILAQHYNFTEQELDYIINYDIKYRMGDELSNYINNDRNQGTL